MPRLKAKLIFITSAIRLVIDWVMKKATCDTASGIKWLSDSKLKDLDFDDDLALLDVSLMGMQDLTSRVEDAAKLTGLQVNAGKTKMNALEQKY